MPCNADDAGTAVANHLDFGPRPEPHFVQAVGVLALPGNRLDDAALALPE